MISADSVEGGFCSRSSYGARLSYYWNKGIPSIVLAVVTVLLAIYSYFFVQPAIESEYARIVRKNVILLGIGVEPGLSNSSQRLHVDSSAGLDPIGQAESEKGHLESKVLLEQTHLCLRRLIITDKSNAELRYQSGLVSERLANWYLEYARGKKVGPEQFAVFLVQSRAEMQKASEAMRIAAKQKGPYALKSDIWLARQQLKSLEIGDAALTALREHFRTLVDIHSEDWEAMNLLGQLHLLQALSFQNDLSAERRWELIRQSKSLFRELRDPTMEMRGFSSETDSLLDPAAGKEAANQLLQSYWSERSVLPHSPESLAAIVRSFLIIGSFREAQSFISEQLQELDGYTQVDFRAQAADASLRQVASVLMLSLKQVRMPDIGNVKVRASIEGPLSLAIQLNPEAYQLQMLLKGVAFPDASRPLPNLLMESLGVSDKPDASIAPAKQLQVSPDLGMGPFLSATAALGAGDPTDSSLNDLKRSLKVSPAFGLAFCRLTVSAAKGRTISLDRAIRWLQEINNHAPDILAIWSERASLHLQNQQAFDAIQCYEFLLKRMPANESIREALEFAKTQL